MCASRCKHGSREGPTEKGESTSLAASSPTRRVKSGLGFFSPETAWNTLQGYGVMNMVRKGQMRGVEQGDILGQIAFISSLFGVAT